MFKLNKLYSNKESFHTIEFKDGLNIIMGKSESYKDKNQKKKTLNGVGKSLIIKLIDFCLGADKNENWKTPLRDWIFCLDYTLDDIKHVIKRSINDSGKILLDGKELKLKEFKEEMKNQLEIANEFTYRECINRFLRKGKKAYNNYFTTIPGEKDCNTLTILIYLLDLDYSKCTEKINLKKDLDENRNLLAKAEKDSNFRALFGNEEIDIDVELANIDFEINKLKKDLNEYKFAENFNDIKNKADNASFKLDQFNNTRYVIESNIKFITESLNQEISVDIQAVKKIYEEINLFWSDALIKSLEEVNNFHYELLKQRKNALKKDLISQKIELEKIEKLIVETNAELNSYLEFLDTHKAMDKYVVIVKKIDQLNEKKNNIQQIRTFEKKIKLNIEKIKQDMSNANLKAQIYLDEAAEKLNKLNSQFMSLAKTFYEDKKSALLIKNNDGENQQRFNIDARITSDGSDGIQEIIIFCFDWILLNSNKTRQGFMYHDSLLIANVENRQKEILFTLSNQLCINNNKQYIININYDQILGFEDEVKKLINQKTILTLTDKSAKEKLLGIEVDLGPEIK